MKKNGIVKKNFSFMDDIERKNNDYEIRKLYLEAKLDTEKIMKGTG